MSFLFGGGPRTQPAPPPPPPPPTEESPEVLEAARKQKRAQALAKGRGSTFLTAGMDLGQPMTQQRTLLGE